MNKRKRIDNLHSGRRLQPGIPLDSISIPKIFPMDTFLLIAGAIVMTICIVIVVQYSTAEGLALMFPILYVLLYSPFSRLSSPTTIQYNEEYITVISKCWKNNKLHTYENQKTSLHIYPTRNFKYHIIREWSGEKCRQESIKTRRENKSIEEFFFSHHVAVKHYRNRWATIAVEDQANVGRY